MTAYTATSYKAMFVGALLGGAIAAAIPAQAQGPAPADVDVVGDYSSTA